METHTKTKLRQYVEEDLKEFDTLEEVKEYLEDVTTHGAGTGTIGRLIYYRDTTDFFNDLEDDIDELIEEGAENQGMTYLEFINSLNGSKSVGNITQLKNLLAWFAYEEIAYQIEREIEELNEFDINEIESLVIQRRREELKEKIYSWVLELQGHLRTLFKRLDEEYDYLLSEECAIKNIRLNELEFDEGGQ